MLLPPALISEDLEEAAEHLEEAEEHLDLRTALPGGWMLGFCLKPS